MTTKAKLMLAAVGVAGAIATILHATPIAGLVFANILSSGSTSDEIFQRVRVLLPAGTSGNDGDGDRDDRWVAKLTTSGPTTVIVQDVEYAPGGTTGWHSHPGILLSTITEGSIEWYDAQCNKHVYKAGDALTESTQTHYVRNVGAVDARFMVTYVLAQGQPRRIDQPAPPCAAVLGLQ